MTDRPAPSEFFAFPHVVQCPAWLSGGAFHCVLSLSVYISAQPLRHSSQFTRAHLTVVLELLVLLAVIAKLTASKENGWAERYKVPAGGRAMSR